MKKLIPNLKEPSTWRGLVFLVTAFGVSINPAQQEAIITAGIAMAGLIGVFVGDS